jgi:hypothetical protein
VQSLGIIGQKNPKSKKKHVQVKKKALYCNLLVAVIIGQKSSEQRQQPVVLFPWRVVTVNRKAWRQQLRPVGAMLWQHTSGAAANERGTTRSAAVEREVV